MKFRTPKIRNYTVLSNDLLFDTSLSLKAVGLLAIMLALPPDWDFTIEGLVAIRKESRTAIESALKELKSHGYLVVTKLMPGETESGRIEYVYDIYETPQGTKIQAGENQGVEKQGVENQGVENDPQLNTEKQSTKEQRTQDKQDLKLNQENKEFTETQEKEKKKKKNDEPESENPLFKRFWDNYPKKVSKGQAEKTWNKLDPDEVLTEKIIEAVETAKRKDSRFRDQRYTPHPSTWLNGREWENEYEGGDGTDANHFHPSTGGRHELPDTVAEG